MLALVKRGTFHAPGNPPSGKIKPAAALYPTSESFLQLTSAQQTAAVLI